MYPQSELDNYKLQVDLLQEKLQRSEENRNQLEHKLEQILQKRSEHDKSVRSKTRQKYQQFLDEQQKRNERNKLLVQMLERIDEQTSAMSARSERLKMMKLQYEMYFAKLVQAQTMRCIHNNAMAATTIPVLLQAPAAAAATSLPLKSTEQTTATLTPTPVPAATTYQIDSNLLPTTYSSGNLYQLSNINETLSTPRHWTLALATPAPTNMYTMSATPPTTAAAARAPTLQDLDYLKYPIGYLPPSMQFAYHQQQQQQQHPNTADMLSTNRFNYNKNIDDDDRRHAATFDEIADINDLITSKQTPHQSRMTTATKAYEKISRNDDNNNENSHHAAEPFEAMKRCENTISRRAAAAVPAAMLSTTTNAPTGTPTPTFTPTAISTSTSLPMLTTTSTALTFDKLSTHNGKSKTLWQSTDEHEAERGAATTTLPAAAGTKLPKAAEFLSYNKSAAAQPNISDFVNANSSNAPSNNNNTHNNNTNNNNNNNNGGKYYDTEKLAAVNRDADDADDANLMRRHKIDEAWPTTPTSPAPTTTTFIGKDNDNVSSALPAGDKRFEAKNNRNSFDTELTPPPAKTTDTNTYQPPQFARKEKMSIENIENTFYGELVKPVAADEVLATTESNKQAALTATNGLLEELTSGGSETIRDSNPAEEQVKAQDEPQQADYVYDSQSVAEPLTNYAPDNQSNFAESAEAGYAATLGDNGGGIVPTENYTTEAEAQQYQQYDATLAAGQDYDPNLDYQNYDAAAYQAAYDPNAYPGYTYDETTGQYTANDENQQYAEQAVAYGEAAYMQQDYSEATMQQEQQQEGLAGNYEDYSQYQQQQQQDELTSMAAAQATADEYNIPATPETAALLPQATASKVDQPNTEPLSTPSASAPTPTEPVAATSLAPIKPILSTEKSAANDAQQKKKKRVNFVDSSETDESSSVKPDGAAGAAGAASGDGGVAGSSESDFDFSSSGGATNN